MSRKLNIATPGAAMFQRYFLFKGRRARRAGHRLFFCDSRIRSRLVDIMQHHACQYRTPHDITERYRNLVPEQPLPDSDVSAEENGRGHDKHVYDGVLEGQGKKG